MPGKIECIMKAYQYTMEAAEGLKNIPMVNEQLGKLYLRPQFTNGHMMIHFISAVGSINSTNLLEKDFIPMDHKYPAVAGTKHTWEFGFNTDSKPDASQ